MVVRGRWREAWAGIVAALSLAGCLDPNPKFVDPLLPTGSSSGGTDATGDPTEDPAPSSGTTAALTTDSGLTETTTSGAMTTSPVTSTTMIDDGCGDGVVTPPEECDDGPKNLDDAACTSACKTAVCGDGLVLADVEFCDDQNDDPADGCVACFLPHVCKEVQDRAANAATGLYLLDPDGPMPGGLTPVFCDMTLDGGGWTRVERSPVADPIGRALFEDVTINDGLPEDPRYRMSRAAMDGVVLHSTEMWLDCGGSDHLRTAASSLFAGEDMGASCGNVGKVLYKEAQLAGSLLTGVELCTGFTGFNDGQCPGAWRIDEVEQELCGLTSAPWDPMKQEMFTMYSADIFAVDAMVLDPAIHQCHEPGAVRSILLR